MEFKELYVIIESCIKLNEVDDNLSHLGSTPMFGKGIESF